MTFVVEEDEPLRPVNIGLFGAVAHSSQPDGARESDRETSAVEVAYPA